jgi:type II secretory pathway component GspD/PulD (secretin)
MRSLSNLVACCLYVSPIASAQGQDAASANATGNRDTAVISQDGSLLSEQIDLARLLDLCAARLKLNVEYDPAIVKGTITFRFTEAISDEQLWTLANRLLASHGFTTVQMAGERTLSVVKLAEAAGQARIEEGDLATARAGFVRVLRRVKQRPVKELVASLQLVLSKPGGIVTQAEGSDLLLLADLKPQVEKALEVLALLDVPRDASMIEEYSTRHLPATELVTLVDRVLTTQSGIESGPTIGKLVATPDEQRVLIVTSPSQFARIVDLLQRFDQREAQTTVTYASRAFSSQEVVRLVTQTLSTESKGSGAPPIRIVEDDLTGTFMLRATASQHAQVAALLERLEATSTSTSRPIRSFKLKNRPVSEILSLIEALVMSGAIGGNEPGNASGAGNESSGGGANSPTKEVPLSGVERPSSGIERAGSENNAGARGGERQEMRSVVTSDLTLSADEGTNTLIATGDGRFLAQLAQLIESLDVRQPQVMVEALVLALTESDALDLGVEIQKLGVNDEVVGRLASLFGLGSPDASGSTLPAPVGNGFQGVILDPGSYSAIIRALEVLNEGRTLTIPRVLVNNNQQGRLDSVLQTPYTSTNASNTVATTSFGGTVDAGTTITLRPQIAEGDHLLLEYDVSVSSFVGDSSDPTLPPPRQQNKVASMVTIPDGYTVVVGGLSIDSDSTASSQIPWLANIPLIGWLFENRSTSKSKSRLYVFLRADVMRGVGFEQLRFWSDQAKDASALDDGTPPRVEPRFIK